MNMIKNEHNECTVINVILGLTLVLIVSLQLMIALAFIFSFFPLTLPASVSELMPRQIQFVAPEREMNFYHYWVAIIILGQGILLFALKNKIANSTLSRQLRLLCAMEGAWLFVMLFAVFKIFVYGKPAWAMHLLIVTLIASLLSKIFWKELKSVVRVIYNYIIATPKAVQIAANVLVPLFIGVLIFVPDLEGVLARMWIGDNLIHMDTTLMGLVWAWAKGSVLNVDVWSHYGLGMPIMVTLLAKAFGAISYTGVLSILIGATIIYFSLSYFFLQKWLKNTPLAIAGVLLAIKWQMFHTGNYPFIFTYPYSTIFRHFFDIIFLFLLLAHIRRGNFYVLVAAGVVSGLAVFHISDTGVYLVLGYLSYLMWVGFESIWHNKKSWKTVLGKLIICAAGMVTTFWTLLYIFQGNHLWKKEFWVNMGERAQLFFMGHGNLPMYKSLVDGDYATSLMSVVIPLVYGAVLIGVGSLCVLKKINRQHILAAVLSVYGLGLYHYYVCRSAGTAYYTVGIPFVFILSWACYQGIKPLTEHRRRVAGCIILGLSLFSLLSTHAYLNYPNLLNFSANPIVAPDIKWPNKDLPYYFHNVPRNLNPAIKLPLNSLGETDEALKIETDFKSDKELKDYFKSEFDYTEDAALISRLTGNSDRVPLFSSFEVRILMQADRKPFFYYYPILDSRPRRMRIFSFSRMLTRHSLDVTIGQLEQSKPPYVFMEKIFLAPDVPQDVYNYLYPDLMYILSYLKSHYQPYAYGKYLVALKRI